MENKTQQFARQLEVKGYLLLESTPVLNACTLAAYEAWQKVFSSRWKFSLQGNVAIPSGFLPLTFARGCEMKESFYYHRGARLPRAVAGPTEAVTEELARIADQVTAELEEVNQRELIMEKGKGCLRIMRYPAFQGEDESLLMQFMAAERQLRSPQHTDLNALTILPMSTAPGLEIQEKNGDWILADSDPRHVIVHTGQELERRSNGRYTATVHRVRNPLEDEFRLTRFSMAYFVS